MPSKTRGTKGRKTLKENIVASKADVKVLSKNSRATRKPLTDKTNSASDENTSRLLTEKPVGTKPNEENILCEQNFARPRRARRLPNRYKENNVLKNLSNNSLSTSIQESLIETSPVNRNALNTKSLTLNKPAQGYKLTKRTNKKLSSIAKVANGLSPLNNLSKCQDISLIKNRPRRICRLPHKFLDQSISPNKHIQVIPVHSSTPLASKTKRIIKETQKELILQKKLKPTLNETPPSISTNKVIEQKAGNNGTKLSAADSNNNAKQKKKPSSSPRKSVVKKAKTDGTNQNLINKNYSLRLLENKRDQLKRDSSKLDVYEFTFDPEEEPPPIKKKKKSAPKKPLKAKTVVKSTYDKNLAKALATLKKTMSSNILKTETDKLKSNNTGTLQRSEDNNSVKCQIPTSDKRQNKLNEKNINPVRIEDMPLNLQPIEEDDNINYSPVNSPKHPGTEFGDPINKSLQRVNDPLNLHDDLSFFDDQPVASSSMNVSVRHPLASPWRAEFNNLPIKWQHNTYIKPNMTPAIESSFINFNESKKKHVYTNIITENETLPQIVDNSHNLKQTSIISFIKEVVEKSANKSRGKSTPIKAHSLFDDLTNTSGNQPKTPKQKTPLKKTKNNSSSNTEIVHCHTKKCDTLQEKSCELMPDGENVSNIELLKDSHIKSNKNNTCFGFDDTEDLENISPIKKNKNARSLRSRTRRILQEINEQKGPTRAVIPVTKLKPQQNIVDKVYKELKSAAEPPVLQEVANDTNTITESPMSDNLENDDSQSVHLFEDMDLLHIYHNKPNRKSYSKAKKVTFHQKTVETSDDGHLSDVDEKASSDENDNSDDVSFKLPSERPKKTIKKRKAKKQLSKKEEQEAEKWAAGFNSMCEDIDEFDLIVE